MSKAWKAAEKEVAGFFGGLRRVRVSYSESVGDVIHKYYSIEVKYGKQVPKCISPELPTKLTVGGITYCVVPSRWLTVEDGLMTCKNKWWVYKERKGCKFLENALEQAERYNPDLMPIVCVKPRGRHGFIAIWED